MDSQVKTEEALGCSKLSRIKHSIESGRLTRPSSNDIHQKRKPQNFLKGSGIFSHHKRRSSLDELIEITKDLRLSPARSTNQQRFDINASPEIATVSPTKSINSDNSPKRFSLDQPLFKDHQEKEYTTTIGMSQAINTQEKISKLTKLKRRTLSMLFDPSTHDKSAQRASSTDSFLEDDKDQIENLSKAALARPKLSKAHSDTRQQFVSISIENEDGESGQPQKELLRKRSKTSGSVENDIYSKKNGSLVKMVGSMVMLRPRPNTPESFRSSDNHSDDTLSTIKIPEYNENETEESYIMRLLDGGLEMEVPSILSEKKDPFLQKCLQMFIDNKFDFRHEPLDVSLRKFLMSCGLPKEAQQIDRVLSMFSSRYYHCNSEVWDSPDQVYFITFSLVMLHTDHFNANNKKKMRKEEFVKNTKVENSEDKVHSPCISKEILEYFYDNITYVKFIQKNKPFPPQQQPQSLYLLPKRVFASASSTNLEVSNGPNSLNQTIGASTRSLSVSSSTSQFFGSNQIDPYMYIAENQIDQLKLNLGEAQSQNPFLNKAKGCPESQYQKIKKTLSKRGGVYIKFHKDIDWLTGKTDIKFKSEEDRIEEIYNVVKIIKIAELYKEETIKNTKFFTMGSTSKVIWKKCFGILTTCGLFIFDNLNFLAIADRGKILDEKNHNSSTSTFIEINFDQVLKSCSKLSINGLFACQAVESSETNYCFNVYSSNKKELFSSSAVSEMFSWIFAINYIAALDSCYLDSFEYEDREVINLRNISIGEKINKLSKNMPELRKRIDEATKLQKHLNDLTPFQSRTKEYLTSYYQSLEMRLDWLWYEFGRNEVYISILQKELKDDEYDKSSWRGENDDESLLEGSFISEDYMNERSKSTDDNLRLLKQATKQRSPTVPPISNCLDSLEDLENKYYDALNDNL